MPFETYTPYGEITEAPAGLTAQEIFERAERIGLDATTAFYLLVNHSEAESVDWDAAREARRNEGLTIGALYEEMERIRHGGYSSIESARESMDKIYELSRDGWPQDAA